MNKNLVFTAFLGALTIAFGAFGAHALKKILSDDQLKSFETGVKYQMPVIELFIDIKITAAFYVRRKFQTMSQSNFYHSRTYDSCF